MSENKTRRLDREYLKKALAYNDLLPPPGDEEVAKLANSHLLALDELAITGEVLVQQRRFLDKLRNWTLTFVSELCPPPHCADTYSDGVREMKEAVRKMMAELATTPCPQCRGAGSKIKRLCEEDGPEGSEYFCGMCMGTGRVMDPMPKREGAQHIESVDVPSNTVGAVGGHVYLQTKPRNDHGDE